SMPVYRTYVAGGSASANDNSVLAATLEMARIIEPSIDPGTFDALSTALHEPGEFAARFEQLSGPVMAKGLEDTLFYRYDRLVALNEVGSDPSAFGMPIEAFHEAMASQSAQIPRTMVGTSTHDTKRSEDVRARIALISEMPDEWAAAVSRWSSMNQTAWNGAMPDPTMEYLLYQTMFGAYPLSRDRAKQFLQKAVREAKQRSSWLDPSEFEATLFDFADEIVDSPAFQDDLASFVARFAVAGRLACLAQVVLKVTLPGVPDFYQGSELWTDGLVDPDNRRPVDYVLRRHLLETIAADPAGQLDPAAADDAHGLLKLRMTKRLLQIRRTVPSCFVGAAYAPLVLNGAASDDAIGYTRGGNVAVVVPVRPLRISRAGWRDTTVVLPGQWVDALGGGALGDGRLVGGTTAIEDVAHHGCMVLVAQDAIR
ncbi:MAG: malto-oligosyltrehalose synthase, partial [Ilumatobacteraceae bacterium]